MRSYWLAAAVIAGIAGATPAAAQRVWQDGRWVVMPRHSAPTVMRTDPHRWAMRDGRWEAGWRAPGGWNGYRRLHRGGTLPHYWRGQDFRVHDYLSFGLAAPPHGYSWVRYYNDAVLVDQGGRVWDSIDGFAWGGAAAAASASAGFVRADARAGAGYPPPPRIEPVDPEDYYYDDRNERHDREDRYERDDRYDRDDRHDGPPPPPYADREPYPGDDAPPPPVAFAPPPCPQACPGGYPAGMAWQNGAWVGSYGGYGAATTTVVVIPAATTTTTTTVTEYVTHKAVRHRTKRLLRKKCACR